ncbi:major facilitator superfamily domain-containing protein [Aspergillus crustosus]
MATKTQKTTMNHAPSDIDNRADEIHVSDKSLLRRIDWRILPVMFLTYFLQFLDKVVLNYANVMNLQADLDMSGNDFSWLGTGFFMAYAVAEIPQGYLLQKYPITKVLGCNVLFWGVILCSSAAAQKYRDLLALRVLLGMTEAVVAPSLTLYTRMWYTPAESTPRFGFWYCGLGVGQILGGVISFGAQHAPASQGLAGWRIMFLVVGVVNILVALLVLFCLPISPETANFLSRKDKDRIHQRLESDSGALGKKKFEPGLILTTLADAHTWLLLLLTILVTLPSGLIMMFSSSLIRGFGYTSKESALLNTPSGIVSILSTMISTYAVSKGYPRWLAINVMLVPTLIGASLMSFLPEGQQAGSLAGIYLVNATVAPLILIYAWTGSNFKGYTGKITGCALISAGFSIANIIGPQTFQARNAPDYLPAKITIVVATAAAIVVATALRILYGRRNAKADKVGCAAKGYLEEKFMENREEQGGQDGFRYVY